MGVNISAADTQAVLDGVRRIVQWLHTSSRRAQQHVGLSGAQLFVLHKLAAAPGSSLNELAAATHTHQSSVSTVVARLERAGLVKRTWSAADGRRLELSLTAKGKQLAHRAPNTAQERLIDAVSTLSAARRKQLAIGLSAVTAAMGLSPATPPMFFEERTKATPKRKMR